MDTIRFIQIFIVYIGMVVFLFTLGTIILKRSRKRLNVTFALFYICSGIGATINIVYAFLFEEELVKILHFATYFAFCYAFVFLFISSVIMFKSEMIFSRKQQNLVLISYAFVLLGLFGIVILFDGIVINESTNWKPTYSLFFLLYAIISVSLGGIIPTIYYSMRFYRRFESDVLKKRYQRYGLGIVIYYVIFYLTSISNYLNIQSFRTIVSIISLSLFFASFLVYYGVGKQMREEK